MSRRNGTVLGAAVAAIVMAASATAAVHHRVPLTFRWPTSVAVVPGRALLVVENGGRTAPGRVVRVAPVVRTKTLLLKADGAYALARGSHGVVYLSAGSLLLRLGSDGSSTTVVDAQEGIGPVAVAANGDVFYATATAAWRLAGGAGPPVEVASGFASPHGLAVTADGGLLVSDTGHGRVTRIDLQTSAAEKWGRFHAPRGIALAPDGQSAYVVDGATDRVVHVRIDGLRLGVVKHVFSDPYAVTVAPSGSVYVVDTAEAGHVYRIRPNGATNVLSR